MTLCRALPLVAMLVAVPLQQAYGAIRRHARHAGRRRHAGWRLPGAPLRAPAAPPPPCQQLLTLRDDTQKQRLAIQAANQRKAPPAEACKLFKTFIAAETKMIKAIERQWPALRRSARSAQADEGRARQGRSRSPSRSATRPRRAAAGRAEPERRARHHAGRARTRQRPERGGTVRHPHRQRIGAMSEAAGRVADSTGNWVDQLARRHGRGPICGSPASTGRSAPGCCCCPAGGRAGLAAVPARRAGQCLARAAVLRRRLRHARRRLHLERHRRSRPRRPGRAHALAADPLRAGERRRRPRRSWCCRRWSGSRCCCSSTGSRS